MVPLTAEGTNCVLEWLGPYPLLGRVSLRHALREKRPGLWADQASHPSCVVWVRESDGRREAFADGASGPVLEWLARQPGPLNLVAPESWEWDVQEAFVDVERASVVTRRYRPADLGPDRLPRGWKPRPGDPLARRLTASDRGAFLAAAPPWALRGWARFENLIAQGAAFGVRVGNGFGSLAWIDATDGRYETVGVFTLTRFRRLGLGRSTSTALLQHILADRQASPLWACDSENTASIALAASLGLVATISEPLMRCSLEPAAS